MGSSSKSEKMMDIGSGMEIFVPSFDQRQNGLDISRKHLLSVKYVKEMGGELKPLYSLVQQQEIGLNLLPFTSIFELEICLAKANGFIKSKKMSTLEPMKLQTDSTMPNYVIDTTPKSYKIFEGCDINIVQKGKSTPEPMTLQIDSTMPNYVIDAAPISYKFPESFDINTLQKGKGKIENSQMVGQVLRVKNVCQSQEPEWRKNWIVQPRQRKNGKYDKYYYHKYSNIICRSLVEIDNFEMHGILPKRASKDINYNAEGKSMLLASKGTRKTSLKRKITSQSFDSCCHTKDLKSFPSNNSDIGLERETEKFLKESYENLLNIFNEDSKSYEMKKKRKVGSSKDDEGSNAASMDNHSPNTKPVKIEDDALVDVPNALNF